MFSFSFNIFISSKQSQLIGLNIIDIYRLAIEDHALDNVFLGFRFRMETKKEIENVGLWHYYSQVLQMNILRWFRVVLIWTNTASLQM